MARAGFWEGGPGSSRAGVDMAAAPVVGESARGIDPSRWAPPPPRPGDRAACARPSVRGKFVWAGGQKVVLPGVTYGTVRPDAHRDEYPPQELVDCDFADMAANGLNAVRTYTAPPPRVLDAAERHGLWLVVGFGLERVIGHLDDRGGEALVEEAVRAQVTACAG